MTNFCPSQRKEAVKGCPINSGENRTSPPARIPAGLKESIVPAKFSWPVSWPRNCWFNRFSCTLAALTASCHAPSASWMFDAVTVPPATFNRPCPVARSVFGAKSVVLPDKLNVPARFPLSCGGTAARRCNCTSDAWSCVCQRPPATWMLGTFIVPPPIPVNRPEPLARSCCGWKEAALPENLNVPFTGDCRDGGTWAKSPKRILAAVTSACQRWPTNCPDVETVPLATRKVVSRNKMFLALKTTSFPVPG